MKRSSVNLGRRDGQALILVIVAMIMIIGALGLGIDVGQMYAQRQMAQAAADAAAQAGAMSMLRGTNVTAANPFGIGTSPASYTCTTTDGVTPCVYARNNGFGGSTADTVTLSYPATVSGVTLVPYFPALTVSVQRQLRTGLIRFVGGPATTTVTAKATAGIVGTHIPYCILALNPSAQSAFQVTLLASVTLNGCGIYVNSNSTNAMTVALLSGVSATAIDIVGSFSNFLGSVSPTPVTGAAVVGDPFAYLQAPTVGSCNFTNYSVGFGTYTLNPGTYCGGINLGIFAQATFNPGIYVINGGGFTVSDQSTATGTGVMFYLTGSNSTYRSATVAALSNAALSAPTSGPYTGLLFFQDRSISSGSDAFFGGAASVQLNGSLYFPTTNVSFAIANSSTFINTAIVANEISFSTFVTSTFYDDPTGLKTGLFSKSVALVQ